MCGWKGNDAPCQKFISLINFKGDCIDAAASQIRTIKVVAIYRDLFLRQQIPDLSR
jgi:hypothetical protein